MSPKYLVYFSNDTSNTNFLQFTISICCEKFEVLLCVYKLSIARCKDGVGGGAWAHTVFSYYIEVSMNLIRCAYVCVCVGVCSL